METSGDPERIRSHPYRFAKQLVRAAQIKERIEGLESELQQIIGTSILPESKSVRPAGERSISAEGKARIIAAQKARWAKFRAQKGAKASGPATNKPKRTMSAAAKARIAAAAARARWKKAKASGKNSL